MEHTLTHKKTSAGARTPTHTNPHPQFFLLMEVRLASPPLSPPPAAVTTVAAEATAAATAY